MELWVVHAPKRVVVGAVMAMAMCVYAAPALAHSMLVKAEPPRRGSPRQGAGAGTTLVQRGN